MGVGHTEETKVNLSKLSTVEKEPKSGANTVNERENETAVGN